MTSVKVVGTRFSIGLLCELPETLAQMVFAWTEFSDLHGLVFVSRGCKEQVYRYLETAHLLNGWTQWIPEQMVLLRRMNRLRELSVPCGDYPSMGLFQRLVSLLGRNKDQLRVYRQHPRYPGYHKVLEVVCHLCPQLETLSYFGNPFHEVPRGFSQLTSLRLEHFNWPPAFLQTLCGNLTAFGVVALD
jgi:hypothetical protein